MIKEIEHSVQARTNPIFLTGKTAVCLMADAGIPDAIEKVNVDDNVKRYYDLSGRPLNGEPTTSGVYIYKDSSSKMRKVFKK